MMRAEILIKALVITICLVGKSKLPIAFWWQAHGKGWRKVRVIFGIQVRQNPINQGMLNTRVPRFSPAPNVSGK